MLAIRDLELFQDLLIIEVRNENVLLMMYENSTRYKKFY